MAVPQKVVELVERYKQYEMSYRSGHYNETQVRRDFIDSLFKILGWDIDNEQGYPEAYRHVIHEDAIRVQGAPKRPDYSFRVGGVRKFFVEAKKPAISLTDSQDAAFQLRRYGWSAKLPVSVLTNFGEFSVYDCRVKPTPTDATSVARTTHLKQAEYLDRWAEIESLFSYDAVLAGSLETYGESLKTQRGIATVDDAFLGEIESWREMLAKSIASANPGLAQRSLNFAVQMTIDRIIFLRICEDRGIELYGSLQSIGQQDNVYAHLCKSFLQADERYNSGLFHFKQERNRSNPHDDLTLNLRIRDEPLRKIINSLYYPESPYEFAVIPADILGQVYERFLGKVIILESAKEARIEEKPEVRKAGGVYYTPTYIVDYIVKNTIGKMVESATPEQVAKLKILDPSCGSGSFLIAAYQYLLDWHLEYYVADGVEKHRKLVYQGLAGVWHLTTDERKRILRDNIYGVDIDSQAVEVTKLSLLLKVLEGETSQTLDTQLRLLHERALPDLSNNIKCGNTLIGPDFYSFEQASMFDEEQRYRLNVFDWISAFPHVFSVDEPGFNAVIGNPPYGASLSKEEVSYLLAKYQFQQYQLDTYLLFFEKGLHVLRHGGMFGMIVPNTWLLNLQSDKIRQYIFNQTQLESIIHYRRRVFPKVTVDTEIVIIKNNAPTKSHEVTVSIAGKDGSDTSYTVSLARWQSGNGKPINIFEQPELVMLADKLWALPNLASACLITQGAKPFQVGKGKPPQTQAIVDAKPFVSDKANDATFRPLLRGSLIQRYRILWNNDYWISFGDWLAEPRYSANYGAPAKIVIRQTGDSLIATLDKGQFIVRDNLYTIVPSRDDLDLRYVLGILNSRLLNWFYQKIINPEQGEALAQVKRGHLAQLPIYLPTLSSNIDKPRYERLIALVDQMLSLNKRFADARIPHDQTILQQQLVITDQQIDQLVYEIYGLTEVEIKIVEGKGMSEEPVEIS